MKIRQGFVSNSSSSSFVYIMSKSDFEDSLSKMDDYQKEVIEKLRPSEKKFLGNDVVIISGCRGNSSSFDFMGSFKSCKGMSEEEFYEKFGYDKWPEKAFDEINWSKNAIYESISF